ncbi:alpha-1,6-mannosyl-glycoprotein 2-beta-N-acetylglucosaminyltransferase-like [Heterodontus francisci]|uniref:alpha-1,6-mannosyl-glycoprotein 2-beta-N-acetylglucosaminyltransferase-like n=1 Tax=Heterodontus francisci TaxID=7792 RepID=UPI00355BEF74
MRFCIYKRKMLILTLTLSFILLLGWSWIKLTLDLKPTHLNGDGVKRISASSWDPTRLPYNNPGLLRRAVYQNNLEQLLLNAATFRQDPELVLVIQVQHKTQYLRLLIESLQQSPDIQRVLLIFSLTHLSQEIIDIVRSVDFCQGIQIIFPYSLQLYPEEFPGQDPLDCPRDLSKEEALRRRCKNAEYPDSYGHYREAQFTQAKHHWAWMLHFVWEKVLSIRNYRGSVLFIEEDSYLLPDFYHFYQLMNQLQSSEYQDCQLLSLGTHQTLEHDKEVARRIDLVGWTAGKHNMGIGMKREVFSSIAHCLKEFCTYDDYNWDWSLQYISAHCLPRPLKVMVPRLPRIYQTSDCGMQQQCEPNTAAKRMASVLASAQSYLFPSSLDIGLNQDATPNRPHTKNGGWGDVRDHRLCQAYTKL